MNMSKLTDTLNTQRTYTTPGGVDLHWTALTLENLARLEERYEFIYNVIDLALSGQVTAMMDVLYEAFRDNHPELTINEFRRLFPAGLSVPGELTQLLNDILEASGFTLTSEKKDVVGDDVNLNGIPSTGNSPGSEYNPVTSND